MNGILKYRFENYEADLRAAELRRNGNRLKLQLQPFQVLVALLERPKDVVTREELRQKLWPEDTFVDFDHGLNTAVAKLRDVLGDSASSPRYIETIAKRGYRFVAGVERVAEPSASTSTIQPATSSTPARENEDPLSQTATTAHIGTEGELPRASRKTSRVLFILAQVMYVIFYLSALFRLDNLHRSTLMAWSSGGQIAFVVYLTTALIGLVVRLYLITATAFDYHLLGEKYRILFPAVFILDVIWALSPLLLADRMGLGLALGATAALIYMPFAQRVLMRMMQQRD